MPRTVEEIARAEAAEARARHAAGRFVAAIDDEDRPTPGELAAERDEPYPFAGEDDR